MDDDYLWDRSGQPDAELQHLERTLSSLGWRGTEHRSWATKAVIARPLPVWLAAAAVVLVAVGSWILVRTRYATGPLTSWQVVLAGHKPRSLRAGELVQTSSNERGNVESAFVGKVVVEPDSRLRLLAATDREQRFALDRGVIHALIWAPPAKFVVDTPAAKTIDLGCQYTLRVDPNGTGWLTVELGWVAFQWRDIESFIPAGAACTTRPTHGPDTPYFLDAPQELKQALAEFDRDGRRDALSRVLSAARRRDALTLWHLLQRTQADERGQVFDHYAALVSAPLTVTRDAILRGDPGAMDAAWDALQLGNTSWWREWKRKW